MEKCALAKRITWMALLFAVLAAGAYVLATVDLYLPCLFYKYTGLLCSDCGAGRCFKSLLHLDIASAFTYNPLLFMLLPMLAYAVGSACVNYVAGRRVLPQLPMPRALAITLLVAIVAFGVLRNIPVFPFDLLAPHGALD